MRFLNVTTALVILGCLVNTYSASGQEARSNNAVVAPGTIQLEASRIYVFVEKIGLGHQHGVEAKLLKSSLALGANQNAGQLVFDMASFNADTPAARKYVGLTGVTDESTRAAVNENMKGEAVLNVKKFPTATFDIQTALPTGEKSRAGLPMYWLVGDFTLHGQTRPLTVSVEAEQARGWLRIRGVFKIKQTTFGIKPYSKAFGTIGVADDLLIYGDLFAAPTSSVDMSAIPERK
jgi:hypothetical protein